MGDNSGPQITVVVDKVRTSHPDHFGLFSGWQWTYLRDKLLRVGFVPENCKFKLLRDFNPEEHKGLIVGMGEGSLAHFTGLKGVDKWTLSPLRSNFGGKFIPTYDFGRIQAQYELGLYLEMTLKRAYEECTTDDYNRSPERFNLNPDLDITFSILDHLKTQPEISVDVETGYGQINTVGFAWSPSDAIAINVLPNRCGEATYYELWRRIADVLEGPSAKIFQNFIYDVSYFSAYGIRTRNINHDTMWAMKFLWPEFDMNLGNVGRFYTKRPYWKDDGKVEGEEGKKKDWGNIRDWHRHYLYNCRDTTGTWEAKQNQIADIKERGLYPTFDNYLRKLITPILEMCSNGVPISLEARKNLQVDIESRIQQLTAKLHSNTGLELNPRSPKQKMTYLKSLGVAIPKKYDKSSGGYRETADSTALKKIRLKHPEIESLGIMLDLASYEKALSSYINFEVKPGEALLRYSLIGTGTETLRFSGGKDPWGRGFNIQTIPQEGGDVSIKSMLSAPEGFSFTEIDLRQAESRFVAYDSADKTLIDMLESGADVHRYVAAEIFHVSQSEVTKDQRQLGKKSGHGANYAMKENTFVETCFSEMDLVLTRDQAKNVLESYHRLFPGIRRWHASIRAELNLRRKLTAPSGWERYFYGRFGDDMFKEAYAWRPQHTIPWITNHLMLYLRSERAKGNLSFRLLVQVHDSLILLVPDDKLNEVALACADIKSWHPWITLPGGELWIPTECKAGKRMSELEEITLE